MEIIQSIRLNDEVNIRLLHGDLTRSDADAIVNAANEKLQHGAGVAGAIVKRGGSIIQTESNAWVQEHGPLTHSEAAITSAGDLPSKAVIHVVGPRWGKGDENRKLRNAVTAALAMATKKQFESLALPAISTGIFGFPMQRAARVIFVAVEAFFENQPESGLKRVDVILFDQSAANTFADAMLAHWPETD